MTTSVDINVPYSSREIKRIKKVSFSVFSPQNLTKFSVCPIVTDKQYVNGVPVEGGLSDPRMAPVDPNQDCASCGGRIKDCQGHFGHLNLARPMYHVGFLKTTVKALRCVCHFCSALLVEDEDPKMRNLLKIKNKKTRLQQVQNLARSKKHCLAREPDNPGDIAYGCGNRQPRYTIDGINILVSFEDTEEEEIDLINDERKRMLSAEEAHTILSKISVRDMERMGFTPGRSEPSWLVMTVLPIPPPPVRPSVSFGAERSEDDLTTKLNDIVKTNLAIQRQEQSGAPQHVIQEFLVLMQWHIFTIIDEKIPGLPGATTKSKKPIKSIRARLRGKEGRLRGNLMGKRVDFSARTVITGDPNLAIDQVGVPKSTAMNLTFPERVTPFNKQLMQEMVQNGPEEWPGAKFVLRSDGSRLDLRYVQNRSQLMLQYGWRVERHMKDNDLVIFNRQPSLHKMSMMGHRAKILPYSTFRLNLSVTSPYNADFDGDEMNLHLAQSHETRAEIKNIMMVPRQIVSPQGNKPVMGIVQDSLLATFKFTRRDTFLERAKAYDLLLWCMDWDGHVPTPTIVKSPKGPRWSGKQIFSQIIPEVTIRRESGIAGKNKDDKVDFARSDCHVYIRNGELIHGIVCKKTVGAAPGSLIHIIWMEKGPEATKWFITNLQKLVNFWLLHEGFTVGAADIVANEATMDEVAVVLLEAKSQVQKVVIDAQEGALETQPGKSLMESFEASVNKILNAARETAGKKASDSLDETNNIVAMVSSGSKGSPLNIAQIIACVGQQNVEGKRIPSGFKDRSLPHVRKDDYGPESRGFVENSYLAGLTPEETYFHGMGGREGIIDTACKTSETGYIQRRLIKSMESVKVRYDGTVRDECDYVVQFLYGEDGMDATYIETQPLGIMTGDRAGFEKKYKHDVNAPDYGNKWLHPQVKANIKDSPELQAILDTEYELLGKLRNRLCSEIFSDGETKQHIPINLPRVLEVAQSKFPLVEEPSPELNPVAIIHQVDNLMKELKVIRWGQPGDTIAEEASKNASIIMNAHIRSALASRNILQHLKLGENAIAWLFGEIRARFDRALAHPGEMVGTIAAQSIGEPATQMTLNTFHFAGVGSKNVTLGVPRLKEIINVAKKVKTPSLTCYLNPDVAVDADRAKDVQAELEHSNLGTLTSYTQIFYDPDPVTSMVPEDAVWVREYYELPDEDASTQGQRSPWVLRIMFNHKVVTDKKLAMKSIGMKVSEDFGGDLEVIWTDDNAPELVMRIRMVRDPDTVEEGDDLRFLKKIEGELLKSVTLKGVPGIKKVYMREERVMRWDPGPGKHAARQEWVLDTDGNNMFDVMMLDEIDRTRIKSNDVVEILQVLGIEATRGALLNELRLVISFDGSYVNYRHLSVLCETMAHRGHLMAISRHGINRGERGPLMKCSFEEMVEMLMDAAMYGEDDHVRGVSENVMLGQLAPIGGAEFDLYIDEDMLNEGNSLVDPGKAEYVAPSTPEDVQPGSPLRPSGTDDEGVDAGFSPVARAAPDSVFSQGQAGPQSVFSGLSSPSYSPTAMVSSPASPAASYAPTSPAFSASGDLASGSSPAYSGAGGDVSGPGSGTSPQYSPTSPLYSGTSPAYSGTSPAYSGTSPAYGATSPAYSPTSPAYSPTSPAYSAAAQDVFSGTSPAYSGTSPAYGAESGGGISPGDDVSPSSLSGAESGRGAGITSPQLDSPSPEYSISPESDEISPAAAPFAPDYDAPFSPASFRSPGTPADEPLEDLGDEITADGLTATLTFNASGGFATDATFAAPDATYAAADDLDMEPPPELPPLEPGDMDPVDPGIAAAMDIGGHADIFGDGEEDELPDAEFEEGELPPPQPPDNPPPA